MVEERIKYLKAFVFHIFKQYSKDRCSSIAAELTVTSLLALVPLSAVIFALLAFVPSFQALGEEMQSWLFKYFVPGTGETVRQYINEFVGKARELSTVGSLMLLITALLMMRTIDTSLNKIWHARSNKSFIRTFLVYWAVLTLGPLLLGSSLFITSYIKSIPVVSDVVENHSQWFTWWLPFLMESIAFSLIFYVIPNRKVPITHALISGGLTAILFEVAKWGFGVFVTSFSTYQLIFGALAAVPLFLIWIYLTWSILLFGAEICHGIEAFEMERDKAKEHPFIEIVNLILLLGDFQDAGKTIDEEQLKLISKKGKRQSNVDWLEKLVEAGLVVKTQEQSYCLLKSLDKIDFLSIYQVAGNQFPTQFQVNQSQLPENTQKQLLAFSQSMTEMLSGHLVSVHCPEKSPRQLPVR
ncbi:YihY family inner membrane protein [Aliikangiella sp. G2MR2-5]|uniref:YihY family inner membrane protein n=1 Tax=Aliikangiella sp. G2MR2-5 TaxID=2788943 RepID=UPI0018AB9462